MNRKKRLALGLCALAAAVAAAVVVVRVRSPTTAGDPMAKPIPERYNTALLQAQLQEQTDASQLRFAINQAVTLAGGKADLLLENAPENRVDLRVVLSLADGTELYRSGVVPPGGQALSVPVEAELPPGEHPALAVLIAVDRDSGEPLGQAEVELTVTVEEVGRME